MSRAIRMALTTLAAAAAGWGMDALGLPLGFLLGAMLLTICAAALRLPAEQPGFVMPWIKGAVGAMLGAAIPADVGGALAAWWPSLPAMFAVMATGVAVNCTLLRRLLRLAPVDAALCAMPGGIAEMILLAETRGADPARVAIVHALRIALSILAIPILAALVFGIEIARAAPAAPAPMAAEDWLWFLGALVAGVAADRFTRLPAALILVPLTVGGGAHVAGLSNFHAPDGISALVQVLIGMNVGARFLGAAPRALAAAAGAAAMVFAVQIGLALAAAVTLARLAGWDPLALTLAYAPGGLAEMSLIAIAMGRETAFVALHHLLRVLTALALAPAVLHRLTGSRR